MLEQYFTKPSTIDRIRASWIAEEIEAYVAWLEEQCYGVKSIWRRVPTVYGFGEFARLHGAVTVSDLPAHVERFVADRVAQHHRRTRSTRPMELVWIGPSSGQQGGRMSPRGREVAGRDGVVPAFPPEECDGSRPAPWRR